MQVIDVHAFDAQIFQAAAQLILQEFRRHAMTAGGKVLGGENSVLDVFAKEIFVGVGRHRAVGREVAAFGAQHDFFA